MNVLLRNNVNDFCHDTVAFWFLSAFFKSFFFDFSEGTEILL